MFVCDARALEDFEKEREESRVQRFNLGSSAPAKEKGSVIDIGKVIEDDAKAVEQEIDAVVADVKGEEQKGNDDDQHLKSMDVALTEPQHRTDKPTESSTVGSTKARAPFKGDISEWLDDGADDIARKAKKTVNLGKWRCWGKTWSQSSVFQSL